MYMYAITLSNTLHMHNYVLTIIQNYWNYILYFGADIHDFILIPHDTKARCWLVGWKNKSWQSGRSLDVCNKMKNEK